MMWAQGVISREIVPLSSKSVQEVTANIIKDVTIIVFF